MDNNMNLGEDICYCRRCMGTVYVVKEGDTIYSIARRYGVTVNDILNSNRFLNIYNLQIGDKLCIPVGMERPQPGTGNMIMPRENMAAAMENEWSMDYDNNGAFELNEIEGVEAAAFANKPNTDMGQCKNCEKCRIDRNTRMTDICNDPNMTFEEFVNCFKMFDK